MKPVKESEKTAEKFKNLLRNSKTHWEIQNAAQKFPKSGDKLTFHLDC